MLDDLMFGEGVLSCEGFVACGILALKATSAFNGMHFTDMSFELASASKGTGAEGANEFAVSACATHDEGEEL